MNVPVIRQLIFKDLRIHRTALLGLSVGLPAIALAMALSNSDWQRLGMILMFNSMIYLQLFLPLGTVLAEKKTFIMSLPVSPTDYVVAKIVGGLLVFLPTWIVFAAILPTVVERDEAMSAGAFPLAAIILAAFLVSYLATSGVALAFESSLATVVVGLLIVVAVFAVMPLLGRLPTRLLEDWSGDVAVWSTEVVGVLGIMGLLAAATVVATVLLARRRTSFI